MGSCNGLLCIHEKPSIGEQSRFHLWNPSTRISKKLPQISNCGYVTAVGFGWVESSDEYKVFVSFGNLDYDTRQTKSVCKVYSSKTKSWKTIEHCAYLYSCGVAGIFAGGKLYWKNEHEKVITFLDIKSEVFGRIEIPLGQEKEVIRVWVMKEEAWKRVATFANLVELLQPAPLVVGPKGEILVNFGSILLVYEILVNFGSILLVYDRQDNVFRCPMVNFLYSPRVYVESLVSPEDV
ncbi:F-box/kelch-repeat protein At3g23880-like [Salvia miltiorrhiza]|uniref:F-box/kelch-repeat protein At3g23880-like n=1 Tax=Salvia miltiorrhiza TaxID=226208 RepID=UPI0025AD5396|nr:F-box/kelch-repeat protein At3g23880-like [Salvia miltiorrhiza]